MSEKPVRIGIIGAGGIASAHLAAYRQVPGVQIRAVCDVVAGKAEEFIRRHAVEEAEAFTDHRRLLAEDSIEAVSVCTPHQFHHRPTVDALLAGKHVMCEKPMAASLAQAMEMVEAAERAGRILTIGFQSRYDANVDLARRVVVSGQLGAIYYVETGGGRRRGIPGGSFVKRDTAGGGALLDIGCYSLDTVLHMLGHPRALRVAGMTAAPFAGRPPYRERGIEVEDFAAAWVRLETGATLLFKIAWAMHADSLGTSLLLGDEGGLRIEAPGGLGDAGVRRLELFHDMGGMPVHTELPLARSDEPRPFLRKIGHFIAAVRSHGQAPIPGHQVLRSMAIIDAIYRSAQSGREEVVATV